MKRIFFLTVGFFVGMNLMAQSPISFYPHEKAQDINVDTHLVIEFDKTVKAGSKGVITVTDKTTRKVVDRIDMSIQAGPVEGQPKNPHAIYTPVPYIYKVGHITNRNTRPGTPSGAAKEDKRKYQKTIIGGFSDAFHFYPVICHGSKATIYLHNNMFGMKAVYKQKV
jgi:pectinesterase